MENDALQAGTKEPKAATILRPPELVQYRLAISLLGEQQNRLAAARTALEREQFFADAADDRCTKLWREICASHDLDPDLTYTVEPSGLVYTITPPE